MNKFILNISFLFGLIFLAGCNFNNFNIVKDDLNKENEAVETKNENQIKTNDDVVVKEVDNKEVKNEIKQQQENKIMEKIYKNNQLGFTFSYPNEAVFKYHEDEGFKGYDQISFPVDGKSSIFEKYIQFDIYQLSCPDYYDHMDVFYPDLNKVKQAIKVNGVNFEKYEIKEEILMTVYTTEIQGKCLEIKFIIQGGELENIDPENGPTDFVKEQADFADLIKNFKIN